MALARAQAVLRLGSQLCLQSVLELGAAGFYQPVTHNRFLSILSPLWVAPTTEPHGPGPEGSFPGLLREGAFALPPHTSRVLEGLGVSRCKLWSLLGCKITGKFFSLYDFSVVYRSPHNEQVLLLSQENNSEESLPVLRVQVPNP